MSARQNIHSYVPDCIMSLKSIGERESSAGSLKGDHTSQGIKTKTSLKHPVQFRVSFSPSHSTSKPGKVALSFRAAST